MPGVSGSPGIKRRIRDAAALNTFGRSHGAFGKNVALHITVVGRIGVDDAADGAMLVPRASVSTRAIRRRSARSTIAPLTEMPVAL